ncbi:MAG: MOSC N-terminal beta barrel domain-containing protein [Planctomycetes bacterium]|nr:MOSC N-terminal beta barrel domain-containing protein [Planctomycetota bacterium]
MPKLNRIAIYPLKSFDPIIVSHAQILASGALLYDRQFAFADPSGRLLNAKRTAAVHTLQVHVDPIARTFTAKPHHSDVIQRWQIDADRAEIEKWFSQYFALNLSLLEHDSGGFPDDSEAPGPTVVGTSTLQTVADWFPGLTVDQVRLRFRANLEIAETEPFWEDRLFGEADGVARAFRIGEVRLAGTNPCQRCVVPSRDPATGAVWPEFAKKFATARESTLPDWAPRQRFDHFYRLTVNTRPLGSTGGFLQLGDDIQLVTT